MARVSGSACALAWVNGVALYSPYLTYDVIHTCTFYQFLRIQWADIIGGFGRKCALKRHFVRPIITGLVTGDGSFSLWRNRGAQVNERQKRMVNGGHSRMRVSSFLHVSERGQLTEVAQKISAHKFIRQRHFNIGNNTKIRSELNVIPIRIVQRNM
eukprot:scaffold27384_cov36-Cyclotella_meneghiniana.AAC.4